MLRVKVSDRGIRVRQWTIEHLGLKGAKLLVFNLIVGFCEDGESWFYGSLDYISSMTGAGKSSIKTILSELDRSNLIIKKNVNQRKNKFKVDWDNINEIIEYSTKQPETGPFDREGKQPETGSLNSRKLALNSRKLALKEPETGPYKEDNKEKKGKRDKEEDSIPSQNLFLIKANITKFLNTALKRKEWLDMLEGLSYSVPEAIEKIADCWIGLDRDFNPDYKPNQKGIVTFAKKWCENEDRSEIPIPDDSVKLSEGLGNTPDRVIDTFNKVSSRNVKGEFRESMKAKARKLMKEGILIADEFEVLMPWMRGNLTYRVYSSIEYILNHYPRLKNSYYDQATKLSSIGNQAA